MSDHPFKDSYFTREELLDIFRKYVSWGEYLCLFLYTKGFTDEQIFDILKIVYGVKLSLHTIKTYRRNAREKLHLEKIPEALRVARLRDLYFVMVHIEQHRKEFYPYMQAREAQIYPTVALPVTPLSLEEHLPAPLNQLTANEFFNEIVDLSNTSSQHIPTAWPDSMYQSPELDEEPRLDSPKENSEPISDVIRHRHEGTSRSDPDDTLLTCVGKLLVIVLVVVVTAIIFAPLFTSP